VCEIFFLYSAVSIFSRLVLSLVSPNLECHVVLRPHFFEEAFQSILAKKKVAPTRLPNSCYQTASRLRFEPGAFCAWVQHANHSATEPLRSNPLMRIRVHVQSLSTKVSETHYSGRMNIMTNDKWSVRLCVALSPGWVLLKLCQPSITVRHVDDQLLDRRKTQESAAALHIGRQ